MKKIVASITINNKKHTYSLEEKRRGIVFVECKDANIAQNFLAEDVASLLIDLPNLIIAEKEHIKKQSSVIRFRVSSKDKEKIERKAVKEGYDSVSDYMRFLASADSGEQSDFEHTKTKNHRLDISSRGSSTERELFMDKCKPSPYYSKTPRAEVLYLLLNKGIYK